MAKIPGLGVSYLSPAELKKRAKRIKLLVCDVDGVLTDGGMYYGPEGEVLKKFDTRDGQGITMARKAGIEVAFVTREKTNFAKARADKLGLKYCSIGALDKPVELARIRGELGLDQAQVAYVGDDFWDIPCIPHVGIFFTPADGYLTKKDGVHVILERGGGRGAVRTAINFLLSR